MAADGECNIDELARRAGTTVRNVRLYQERGLLPKPRREGRAAYYGEHHLHRLQLVRRLMDRGYSMASIRELTQAWDARQDLGDVLGLEDALARPYSEEGPRWMSADEVAGLFPSTDPDGDRARAIELGLLVPDGDGYVVPSVRFLEAGAGLVASGVPVAAVLDVGALIVRSTSELAAAFVDMFVEHVWQPFEDAGEPADDAPRIAEAINRVRPLAVKAVVAALEQAMQERHDDSLMLEVTEADTA